MKIFGDDGFRDKFNQGLLSKIFLNQFFNSLNFFLNKRNIFSIYIAYDTRLSARPILKIILSKLKNLKNIFIIDRPVTTPYLNYLSKKKNSFCVMITASHFSWNYNGFKFFKGGNKITKNDENIVINYLKKKQQTKISKKNIKKTNIKKIFPKNYINSINNKFKTFPSKKIIFDLAYGSASSFRKDLNIFKKFKIINYRFNGKNINKKSGSNHIQKTFKKLKSFDYLISFDGDADRVVIAKKNYGIIESEKLALIFAKYFSTKKRNKLNIVGTEISNPWLKEQLKKIKIDFVKSKVGDRNVINKQIINKSIFGFETSGHFSFLNSMDGIYTSALFLNIMKKNPKIIDEILLQKINYNQIVIKIIPNKYKSISKYLKKLKNLKKVKIIKRKSIWEDVIKIYIFYKNNFSKDEKIFFENNFQKVIKNKFH